MGDRRVGLIPFPEAPEEGSSDILRRVIVARSRISRGLSNADLAVYGREDFMAVERLHSCGKLLLVCRRCDRHPGLLLVFNSTDLEATRRLLDNLPSVAVKLTAYDLTTMEILLPRHVDAENGSTEPE